MAIQVEPDWWKKLFDGVYLMTDARSVCDAEVTRREVDLICSILPVESSHKILDLCGGQGRHSLELCERGFDSCVVLDYSSFLIEHGKSIANKRDRDVEFIQGDARDTGLAEKSFDHVMILGNSLGYLPEPEDDACILEEARRILKPEGWLLLDVADGSSIQDRLNPVSWHETADGLVVCRRREMEDSVIKAREVVISKEDGLVRDSSYAIRVFTPKSLAGLVKRAGFSDPKIITDFSAHQKRGDFGFMNHRMILTAQKN